MPKRLRLVGCIKYDPKEAKLLLEEPKSTGSKNNTFLTKARYELSRHKLFDPSSKDFVNIFGGGVREVRKLYRQSVKREMANRPPMTEKAKAAFARQQQLMKEGKIRSTRNYTKRKAIERAKLYSGLAKRAQNAVDKASDKSKKERRGNGPKPTKMKTNNNAIKSRSKSTWDDL